MRSGVLAHSKVCFGVVMFHCQYIDLIDLIHCDLVHCVFHVKEGLKNNVHTVQSRPQGGALTAKCARQLWLSR